MKIYAPHFLTFGILRNKCCEEEELIDCGNYLFNQNRIVYVVTNDEIELFDMVNKLAKTDICILYEVVTFKSFCDINKNKLMSDYISSLCGKMVSIIILHPDEYTDKGCIKMGVDIPELSFNLLTKYIEIEKG